MTEVNQFYILYRNFNISAQTSFLSLQLYEWMLKFWWLFRFEPIDLSFNFTDQLILYLRNLGLHTNVENYIFESRKVFQKSICFFYIAFQIKIFLNSTLKLSFHYFFQRNENSYCGLHAIVVSMNYSCFDLID
jgi:hypothetical protein